MPTQYIFVTGGVVSSLGKGVAAASIAALLQARGYKVRLKKLDPYLNVDPGTMSPYQHGEVFVTEDGEETDLDFGYYERFTDIPASKNDTITSGKVYEKLISRERSGAYLGGTVQVIPHFTNIIKDFIKYCHDEVDFMICEIGGTVGDIEAQPYIEAARQMRYEYNHVMFIHLTLLPYIATSGELKTKPSQHSVKELRSMGIQPDLIICRADREISQYLLQKVGASCGVSENNVIPGIDQSTIYKVPLSYHKHSVDSIIIKHFQLPDRPIDLKKWHWIENRINIHNHVVKIGIVGKYNELQDAYKSLLEAFLHAGLYHKCKVDLIWINSGNDLEAVQAELEGVDGIMVPGGFGARGVESKIFAIKYARETNTPLFGICLGMQLLAVEFARNVLKIGNAHSTEFSDDCTNIIDFMTNWSHNDSLEIRDSSSSAIGGTMRLGNYEARLNENTKIKKIYNRDIILERHRHRFEFNIEYRDAFEASGMIVGATSSDLGLVESLELKDHRWFIGVQFHPEYKSRPFDPHPLFLSFIEVLIEIRGGKNESSEYKKL